MKHENVSVSGAWVVLSWFKLWAHVSFYHLNHNLKAKYIDYYIPDNLFLKMNKNWVTMSLWVYHIKLIL